jgi:hypothetical protein
VKINKSREFWPKNFLDYLFIAGKIRGHDSVIEGVAGDLRRICFIGVMKRFGYLHDRLFQFSLVAYAINRLLIRPHLGGFFRAHWQSAWPFLHSHFDDLLLMPVALPVMLWLQQLLGLRKQDDPPGWQEMFAHLAVWSVMCKIIGPLYLHIGVADPLDVLFFAAGGIVACAWWNRPVRPTQTVTAGI